MKLLGRVALIHRGWRYRLRVDPAEIRWMRSVLRPGDVAVDVGAYKGGYTYWMRSRVGGRGAVVAFEPQRGLASYLRDRVGDFGWHNVRVEETALSSQPGAQRLRLPGHGPSPGASLVGASLPEGGQSYEVRVETLDRFFESSPAPGPVRLIKCDVEGHELEVFLGAERTLTRDRPLLLFECEARHLRGHAMEDVFAHLEARGYRGSFFWSGQRLDVRRFDLARHQVEGLKPYGNNFLFEPGEARRA